MTPLQRYVSDHRFLLDALAQAAGLADPVAVDLDEYRDFVLKKATRGPVVPLDGVLVRDWDPDYRKVWPGVRFGARLYDIDGIRFARAYAGVSEQVASHGYDFFAVGRADYARLYKTALRCRRETVPALPPVLPADQFDTLRRNTIDYLDPANLKRIKAYGGRPKRGLLLVGPPGNGKTSACRWVWQHCAAAGHEYRFVTPDDYRAARASSCNPADRVRELFQFGAPGVVFFDDMDVALRNRDKGYESDDQAVFLGALDGIEATEGVVYVFTTNCDLDLIDPAIRRPGRIDVVLHFPAPDATMRRQLLDRWHPDARAALDLDAIVEETDGLSFAEIEEMRNLLVMHFMDAGRWEWDWAVRQFETNRRELGGRKKNRRVGFAAALNGKH